MNCEASLNCILLVELRSTPVSATWVRVTSWSSPNPITAPSAKYRSLNSNDVVPKEAPSDASGKNAVEAVMFVPVSAPVTPNVPATVAFTSTSRVSICAVPSINISLNSSDAVPKSISLVVMGTIAPSCIRTCCVAAPPTSL